MAVEILVVVVECAGVVFCRRWLRSPRTAAVALVGLPSCGILLGNWLVVLLLMLLLLAVVVVVVDDDDEEEEVAAARMRPSSPPRGVSALAVALGPCGGLPKFGSNTSDELVDKAVRYPGGLCGRSPSPPSPPLPSSCGEATPTPRRGVDLAETPPLAVVDAVLASSAATPSTAITLYVMMAPSSGVYGP